MDTTNKGGWTRPSRGAIRFDDRGWDSSVMQAELGKFPESDWDTLAYGDAWGQIPLVWPVKEGLKQHALLAECPTFQAIFESFPGRLMDAALARLGPGGWVKEHRDISGGVAMGIARFHVPVRTHAAVEIYVGGERCRMGEGEVWSLDTTYKHRLKNMSDVWRVHLILDVEMNDDIRALYPPDELRDKLHRVGFNAIVASKGVRMGLTDPRRMVAMAKRFIGLKLFGRNSLVDVE